jgi:hypothetical protein
MFTEMKPHIETPHDDREVSHSYTTPAFSTIGIVTFFIGLLWLAVTFGGAE